MGIHSRHGDSSAMSGPRLKKIDVNKGRGLPLIVSAKGEPSTSRAVVSSNTVLEKLPGKKDRARRSLVESLAAKRLIPAAPSTDLAFTGKRPSGSDVTSRRRDTSRSRDHRFGNLEGHHGGFGTQHGESSPKHGTSSLDIRYGSKASFAYTQIRDTGSSVDSDNGHHPSEDVVKMVNGWNKSKGTKTDTTQRWVKCQPITPKLIEKLNKMKISSRTRTEEWVKQIPAEKRAYHSSLYRLGNVVNDTDGTSPVSYDSWIYEEIRK